MSPGPYNSLQSHMAGSKGEIESDIMSGIIWSTPRLQYPRLIQDCLNNLRLILDYVSVSNASISVR